MNSIFFFIPFLAVAIFGTVQDAYSFDVIVGYNYFDVINPDGTHVWTTHHPYILNQGVYVPYVQNGLQVNSAIGNVILNADGSYTWNGKFTDRIIAKYSDITDQVNWTYPATLNNDTPDLSFADDAFHSNKIKAGIGDMDYKYVFDHGKWRTELIVTNLSSLTTKVFGFDQIIDLQSDTIKFGGITRNLDNFDGMTFDKEFLDNNRGKMLDLLNGVNFDFDRGYDNLYSITVYDTGENSSRLVFDFRTTETLSPLQTLVIDPVFSGVGDSYSGSFNEKDLDHVCEETGGTYDNLGVAFYIYTYDNTSTFGDCIRSIIEWDISSIPAGASVSDVHFKFEDATPTNPPNPADIWAITSFDPSTRTSAQNFDECNNDTQLVDDTAIFNTANINNDLDLGASADTTVEAMIALGYYSICIKNDNEVPGAAIHASFVVDGGTPDFTLEVTYTPYVAPNPDAVDDLASSGQTYGSVDLYWTEPNLNTGNLTGYQINYTTPWADNPDIIITNNTGSSDTSTTVSGLDISTPYSFRIGVWTEGFNAGGNVLNVTTQGNFTIGSAVFNQTNSQVLPITFEQQEINSTAKFLNVTYANTFSLACNFHYKFANTNQTYSGLDSYAVSTTLNETAFIFNNFDDEVIDVYCWDTVTNTNADYLLVQNNFPLLQQVDNFRNGTYGTQGKIGVFDFVTIAVVIFSMIGLNRVNESVGTVFNVILLSALAYFGIIELPTIIFGFLTVVIVFAVTSTRKT